MQFYGDSVKNESTRTKRLQGGQTPPLQACLGLKQK